MITITHAQLVAAGIAAAGLIAWLIAGMYWLRSREYARQAVVDREAARRDLREAAEERNKAELVLEEAKRHGYRPDRRPASGKWGRLGYSDGPVGPERAGPETSIGTGPSGVTGYTGPHRVPEFSGPMGPSGSGLTESEVMVAMLEFKQRQGQEMNSRYIRLFKEIMSPREQERRDVIY